MEQFTSGPWTANKAWSAHPRFGIFKDRNIVVGKAWTEEDARLIATAPELYRYLSLALDVLDRANVARGGEPAARQILAKARGAA